MYAELWSRFSGDYRENCLVWEHGKSPIIPPSGEGWQAVWTANPDFLTLNGRLLLFYRGNGYLPGRETAHDRIGVAEVLSLEPNRLELRMLNGGLPVVDVGAAEEFDGVDVLDPATVFFQGKVYLYDSFVKLLVARSRDVADERIKAIPPELWIQFEKN